MNIEEPLLNLVKPPRHKMRNYQGRHTQFLNSFSRFTNAIQSFDNCRISFTLLKNIKTSATTNTCVVYSHSHGSTGEEGLELLEACQDQGVSLCYYDSRGCGESGDAYVTFGVNENIDLLYICFYLVVIYEIDEFILWGRSIGSCAVLQLADNLVSSIPRKGPNGIPRPRYARVSGPNSPKIMSAKQYNSISDFSLESHLNKFLELNNFINENPRQFSVIGLVVDSAPKSIIAAVEHFVKVKFLNLKLFTKVASLYSENWIKNKIGVDITIRQNCQLVRTINANTIFLISPKDEMVPFEDSMELLQNFSMLCDQKCYFDVLRMNKGHKERRDSIVYENAINTLITKKGTKNQDRFVFELASSRIFSPETDTLKKNKLDPIRPWNDRISVMLKIPVELSHEDKLDSQREIMPNIQNNLPSFHHPLVNFRSNPSLPDSRPESAKTTSQGTTLVMSTRKMDNKSTFFGQSESKLDSVRKRPPELFIPLQRQSGDPRKPTFPVTTQQPKTTHPVTSTKHLIFEDSNSSPLHKTRHFNFKNQNSNVTFSAKFDASALKNSNDIRFSGSQISPFNNEHFRLPRAEIYNSSVVKESSPPPNLAFKSTTIEIPTHHDSQYQTETSNLMRHKSGQELSHPIIKAVNLDSASQYPKGFYMSPGSSKFISNNIAQNSMHHPSFGGDHFNLPDKEVVFDSVPRQPLRHLPTQSPNIQVFNPQNSPQKTHSQGLIKQSSIEVASLIELSGSKDLNQSVKSNRLVANSGSHMFKESSHLVQVLTRIGSDTLRKLPGDQEYYI